MKIVVDVIAAFVLIILMAIVGVVLFVAGLIVIIVELAIGLVKTIGRGIKNMFNKYNGGSDFAKV